MQLAGLPSSCKNPPMKHRDTNHQKSGLSRRRFIGGTAATAVAFPQIIPGGLLGQNAPSKKLNIAFIGAGGRGAANVDGCFKAGQIVHALADVDDGRVSGTRRKFPDAKFYKDWREMLEAEGDKIDAVAVSTPDHTHAVAAMAAIKLGKHVYVEKPLTLSIAEARALHTEANKRGLCTQMGNTGHAKDSARLTNEFARSGSLGEIKTVHCRTNRPIWPQDMVRPKASNPPAGLDWDAWLGPAQEKPYGVHMQKRGNKTIPKPIAPFNWRGYLDYGTGALGDMGAHIIDHPVWALELGLPKKVVVEKADRKVTGSEKDTHPQSCIIHYYFDGVNGRPPLHLTWFDGQYKIPRIDGMPKDRNTPDNGCVYHGSKHTMMHGSHGGKPELIDPNRDKFVKPPETEERSPGHYVEWVEAIQTNDPSKAKSNFDTAAPLTETLLLGVIGSILGRERS